MTISWENDLELMESAAYAAGERILAYYRPGDTVASSAEVREKSHDNPLTKADLEADQLLHTALMAARPAYGWLSEETRDDPARLDKECVWVVDPIDGTKEFIKGVPEFAVSIGLVAHGRTVAACVYNPATCETFTALDGVGCWRDGQPVRVSMRTELQGASCLTSRSETKRGEWRPFEAAFSLRPMGSIAYKLAQVACGAFDLSFTLTPKSEWDFCAGELLVRSAGGRLSDKAGQPFLFNQSLPKVRSVLSTNGVLHAPLLARLADVPLGVDRYGEFTD